MSVTLDTLPHVFPEKDDRIMCLSLTCQVLSDKLNNPGDYKALKEKFLHSLRGENNTACIDEEILKWYTGLPLVKVVYVSRLVEQLLR
jgi:hypothetical protein